MAVDRWTITRNTFAFFGIVRVPDHWDRRLRPGQLSLGSEAVITTRGFDSAIGDVLVGTKRPDLVIIDDPETRDSARSGVHPHASVGAA